MACPAGEDLEIDFCVRIGGKDMDGAANVEFGNGFLALNKRFRAEQAPGIDLAVVCFQRQPLA